MNRIPRLSRFAALTVPPYLALLWLVASSFRTGGFEVFLGGSVLLGCGWLGMVRGRSRFLFALYYGVFLVAGLIGTLELFLWLFPGYLRGMAANYAYGRYHAFAGGIYFKDAHQGKILRPNLEYSTYFNGYRWIHKTNSRGFRGEDLDHADAVFLGDSMIYGQGVENDQTVSARYQYHTGQKSANLGIQGTGLMQSWIRLRRIGLALNPRLVFVCAHPNDLGDNFNYYDAEQIRLFLSSKPEDETEPMVRSRFQPRASGHLKQIWDDNFSLALKTGGAVRALGIGFKVGFHKLGQPAAGIPDYQNWKIESSREQLAWQAHCHALAKIHHACQKMGARLVVFDLGFPEGFSRAMEAEARRLGAGYSKAGQIAFQRSQAGDEIYLPQDGHWSPLGCDLVARHLSKEWAAAPHPSW